MIDEENFGRSRRMLFLYFFKKLIWDGSDDSGTNDKVLNNSVLSRVIQRFPVEVSSEEYLGKEKTERNAK